MRWKFETIKRPAVEGWRPTFVWLPKKCYETGTWVWLEKALWRPYMDAVVPVSAIGTASGLWGPRRVWREMGN